MASHRDTWYSAPCCQINWWIPIYEMDSDNALAFHPRYWKDPVKNDSSKYNYYQWNREYKPKAAQSLKEDPRPLFRPTEPIDLEESDSPHLSCGRHYHVFRCSVHSTVPNNSGKTRFSIDFRTVNRDDLMSRLGAPNIDSECTGTTLRDFLRAADSTRVPEEVVALYDDETASTGKGELVYNPSGPS